MNLLNKTLLALILILFAPLGAAQVAVDFRGRIVPLIPPICSSTVTHSVECTRLHLRSSTVNLAQFEGQVVVIRGTLQLLSCPIVDVDVVEAAAERTTIFSLSSYRLGSSIVWTTVAPIGSLVGLFISMNQGFLPISTFGALAIDPVGMALIGIAPSVTVALHTVQVPNDPALLGFTFYTQAFSANLLGNPVTVSLLNPTCFKLRQ
jgi:hypothetical protein